MTNEEYQRALDARDPRGVEMIEQLVGLAMSALETVALELHANVAFGYGYQPGSDMHRDRLLAALRERFAQAAQAYVVELDDAFSRGLEEAFARANETRYAVPDAGEVDEPAMGDAVHDRNFRHDSMAPAAEDDGA